MRKSELAAILALLLAAPAALAREGATTAMQADLSILPQGCRDAIARSAMSGMPTDMHMADMMGGMEGMDEAQQASMHAMMKMTLPMMATHAIEDPDLAFNCGMIAHHAGAIAMAEVELRHGADEASKALAREIIDAQGPELEKMTAWVEEHTGER